jgi:hypothetical protein
MPQHQVIQAALLGVGIGFAAWLLDLIVRHIVLVPLFCGNPSSTVCVNQVDVAGNVATIIVIFVGMMGLVRFSIYRPLIIVLATAISLWGIGSWTGHLAWYETLAWFVLLYALCYVAFAWLVRPRLFLPMIMLVTIAILFIRLLPIL